MADNPFDTPYQDPFVKPYASDVVASSKTRGETRSNAEIVKDAWSYLTSPTTPVPASIDSLKNIAIGAGVGGVAGAAFPVVGAPAGALAGGVATAAEEIAKSQGASPLTTLGVGLAAPTGVNLLKMAAVKGLVPLRTYFAKNIANSTGAEEQVGKLEQLAIKEAQTKVFGPPKFTVDYSIENALKTQTKLREQYLGENINSPSMIDPEFKVSSILRKQLFESIDTLKDKVTKVSVTPIDRVTNMLGQVVKPATNEVTKETGSFVNSNEFKALMEEAGRLVKYKKTTGGEVGNMVDILKLQMDSDPIVRANSTREIINLIQNGGVYKVSQKGADAETKTLISDNLRQELKDKFDDYLQTTLGKPAYSQLKQVERLEFQAEARDLIPDIIANKFKLGSDDFDKAMNTLKSSPTGKEDMQNALLQHFGQMDDANKMKSSLITLRSTMSNLGMLDRQGYFDILRKIESFKDVKDKALFLNKVKSAILTPLMGVTSASAVETPYFSSILP